MCAGVGVSGWPRISETSVAPLGLELADLLQDRVDRRGSQVGHPSGDARAGSCEVPGGVISPGQLPLRSIILGDPGAPDNSFYGVSLVAGASTNSGGERAIECPPPVAMEVYTECDELNDQGK